MQPGDAWPDEVDRKWAVRASWVWVLIMGGNAIVGSEPYLRLVMLLLLVGPALTFIRAVVQATAAEPVEQ